MKFPRSLVLLIAIFSLVCMACPSLRADGGQSEPTSNSKEDDGGRHARPGAVSLEQEMKAMGRDYRIIRTQVADPTKNASTLAAVLDLEQHTVAAKSAIPHVAATQPTTAQAASTKADYQVEMIALLRQEMNLEEALLANDGEKAVKTASDLHGLEEKGHKQFRPRRHD